MGTLQGLVIFGPDQHSLMRWQLRLESPEKRQFEKRHDPACPERGQLSGILSAFFTEGNDIATTARDAGQRLQLFRPVVQLNSTLTDLIRKFGTLHINADGAH
jgi:hypothetical protein